MNALMVSWRLRTDLLAILAAATPQGGERASEKRLLAVSKIRRHRGTSHGSNLVLAGGEQCAEFGDELTTITSVTRPVATPDCP